MKPRNEEKVATSAFSTSYDVRNEEVRDQSDRQAFETRTDRSASSAPRSEKCQPFGQNTTGGKACPNKQPGSREVEREHNELEHFIKRYHSEQQHVLRARIVLSAAQGTSNAQIARELA